MQNSKLARHRCLTFLVASLVLVISSTAFASRAVWKRTTLTESNEAWRVDLEIYLNSAPDIAHVPMQFKFEQKVYYELSRVDGKDKPVMRRVPMEGKAPLLETVDMGFLDPGTGKLMSRTRFSFRLTRERGFEAGEYLVSIKNKRTGRTLGPKRRIIFKGENDVIDRRSMVFAEKKKKKAQEATPAWQEEYDPKTDPENDEFWEGGPTEPEKKPTLPPPAHMQEKPGGCIVKAAGKGDSGATWIVAGVAALVLARRRRTLLNKSAA